MLLLNLYFMCVMFFVFLFFKQKTAYEMRISDWSSDVCSSDLPAGRIILGRRRHEHPFAGKRRPGTCAGMEAGAIAKADEALRCTRQSRHSPTCRTGRP